MELDRLEKLKTRRDRINARISKIAARKYAEQRRLEKRRKIVAGGVLLAAVEQDAALEKPEGIARWWQNRLYEMRLPQDRQLFELQVPAPTERDEHERIRGTTVVDEIII